MLLSALVMRHYLSQADQLADTTDQVSLPMALMAADMKLQAVQVQQFLSDVSATHRGRLRKRKIKHVKPIADARY